MGLVPCSSLIPSSSEEMVTVEVLEGRIPEGARIGATGEFFFSLGFKTECRAAQESPDVTPRRKAEFWLPLLECDLWWALPILAAEMDTVEPVIKTAPTIMAANLFFFIFPPPIVFIQGVERRKGAFRYRESGIFCPPLDFEDLHQKFYEEGTRHMDQPLGLAEFNANVFSDLLEGNRLFVAKFRGSTLTGSAAKGLGIVTCMDSRIDPLAVVGMHSGDVKILRNAGARVTEDVLRTLVLATYLLGVNRILIMPHTDCRMAESEEADIHATIADQYGVDTRSLEFRTVSNQREALITDVIRIRSYPLLPDGVTVGGAIYNVATGALESVGC